MSNTTSGSEKSEKLSSKKRTNSQINQAFMNSVCWYIYNVSKIMQIVEIYGSEDYYLDHGWDYNAPLEGEKFVKRINDRYEEQSFKAMNV